MLFYFSNLNFCQTFDYHWGIKNFYKFLWYVYDDMFNDISECIMNLVTCGMKGGHKSRTNLFWISIFPLWFRISHSGSTSLGFHLSRDFGNKYYFVTAFSLSCCNLFFIWAKYVYDLRIVPTLHIDLTFTLMWLKDSFSNLVFSRCHFCCFSDPTVHALQFLDVINMKDPTQKSHFYRNTLKEVLPYIPRVSILA